MSHYVNGYVGRGTSINLAGFGAAGNPMEMFWNTLKPMQDGVRSFSSALPGMDFMTGKSTATKTTNKASSSSVADPAPSNKGKYLLAGVGAVGVIGLLALVLKKKKD